MSSKATPQKIVGTSLPLFSLRSRASSDESNCGTVADAPAFLDWLDRTGQRAWQVLPLSQTHLEPGSPERHVPSPYKGYGIGLDPRYLAGPWADLEPSSGQISDFSQRQADWLNDYAVFCALRDSLGTDDWNQWPDEGLRRHDPAAVSRWAASHDQLVRRQIIIQWRLEQAFRDIRNQAAELGIEKIGDLPFYLPQRSPLVWANQNCFEIDDQGRLERVSGIPNGPDSHFGRQVWGHPLYRWQDDRALERILGLWRSRLKYYAWFYDTLRLDHAKGFYNYGAISPDGREPDLVEGGPGDQALEQVIAAGREAGLKIFAEDSGDRLVELRQALGRLKVPGIRILRFAYNENKRKLEQDYSQVASYPDDAFAYTTTHDTVTLISYVRGLTEAERRHLCEHVGVAYSDDQELLASRLRQAVLDSPAGHAIIPLQDWLLLPDRVNVPGTETAVNDANWRWRMPMNVEDLPERLFGHRPAVQS